LQDEAGAQSDYEKGEEYKAEGFNWLWNAKEKS